MKTNEEILKEVLSKKRTKLNKTIEELIRFEPVTSPEIRGWLYEAISSTREDCEKERKIEAHTQVSMNAYDKGFENGQKAERERILEIIDNLHNKVKALTEYHYASLKSDRDEMDDNSEYSNTFDKGAISGLTFTDKEIEELKKEVLKE